MRITGQGLTIGKDEKLLDVINRAKTLYKEKTGRTATAIAVGPGVLTDKEKAYGLEIANRLCDPSIIIIGEPA